MRILYITDSVPYPPVTGAPLRTYNLLKNLGNAHEIWFAAFCNNEEQSAGIAKMREICHAVITVPAITGGAMAQPSQMVRYALAGMPPDLRFSHSQQLGKEIENLTANVTFDVIQIDHTKMGIYLDHIPSKLHSKSYWMLHDIEFNKLARIARIETKFARRLRLRWNSRLMRRWEPAQAARFQACTVVSEQDRSIMLKANPNVRTGLSPNGVDTSAYQLLPGPCTAIPRLLYVGNMDYMPNVDAVLYFCEEILPYLQQQHPRLEFWIVGAQPRPVVRALQDQTGVYVTGRVDDIRPYYQQATACVIPLRAGGGTRLKILEAMALGRPVVSTSLGCEGLDAIDAQHLLIADRAEEFIRKTLHLLNDQQLYTELIDNARELVEKRYDWHVIAQDLLALYQA